MNSFADNPLFLWLFYGRVIEWKFNRFCCGIVFIIPYKYFKQPLFSIANKFYVNIWSMHWTSVAISHFSFRCDSSSSKYSSDLRSFLLFASFLCSLYISLSTSSFPYSSLDRLFFVKLTELTEFSLHRYEETYAE